MRRVLLAVGLSFACAALLTAQQPAAESPAATAARKRQEAIKSVEIRFHLKETVEPAAHADNLLMPNKPGTAFPDKQTVIESDNRLVIEGEKLRLELNHPMPDLRTRDWPPSKSFAVVNGGEAKSYHVRTDREIARKDSVATIRRSQDAYIAMDLNLLPLMLNIRGENPRMCSWSFAENKWQPDGATVQLAGVVAQPYRHTASGLATGSSLVCWVDPANDHAIRRIRIDIGKGETVLLDAVLDKDIQTGIVYPKSWKKAAYNSAGKLRITLEYSVTSIQFNYNPDPAEFDLVFPPNVEVSNQIEGKSYLVRADGSFQLLPRLGADSAAIQQEAASGWWRRNRLLLTAVAVVSVLLGWLGRKQLSGNRANSPPTS